MTNLKKKIRDTIPQIENWFASNGVLMSRSKTEIVTFCPIHNKESLTGKIYIEQEVFEIAESTKFLGIYIDSHFRWCKHIQYLCTKLPSVIFAINELRNVLDFTTLKVLYFPNFHSLISYGIIFWGNSIDVNRIFVLQKRAIRAMLNLKPRDSCKEYFINYNIPTVISLYILECASYVKKHYSEIFHKNELQHPYITRNKDKVLCAPFTRLEFIKNGPLHQCIKMYNNLPENLKRIENYRQFRKETKLFVTQKCYYNIKEYISSYNCQSH